jgi:hypothetical protein
MIGEEILHLKRTIMIVSPRLLIIALIAVVIFASVNMQRASANDDRRNDDHNFCNGNHHSAKCLHNDGTPFLLPSP